MDGTHYLHIDRGKAAFEKLDEEVIIVDVETGLYFSLRGSAVVIWDAIDGGTTVAGLHARMATAFDGAPATIAAEVDHLIATLASEGILAARPEPPATLRESAATSARIPYVAPQIERFADVQDLLTLDPIHDVSDFGWPHPKDMATKLE